MLPTLRLILAGVSALFLVTLGALSLTSPPPEKPTARVATSAFGPRGVLISRDDHPEWRQFLVQAALRRADELSKLRDLPDQADPNAIQLRWASLPLGPRDQAAEEDVEELTDIPTATIPVDIGAASSSELPVLQNEEALPKPVTPKDAKDARQSEAKPVVTPRRKFRRIARRTPPPKPEDTNPFAALFGSFGTPQ